MTTVILLLFLILVAILCPSAFVVVPLLAATVFGKAILAGIVIGTILGIGEVIVKYQDRRSRTQRPPQLVRQPLATEVDPVLREWAQWQRRD